MARRRNTQDDDERKEQEEFAKRNLRNDYITGLAAVKLGNLVDPEKYAGFFKKAYPALVANAPDQNAYEQLFLQALLSEEGALNKPLLLTKAASVYQESVISLSVPEALREAGYTGSVKGDYKGKYVDDLSDEEKSEIVSSCSLVLVNRTVTRLMDEENKTIAGGLEKKFGGQAPRRRRT